MKFMCIVLRILMQSISKQVTRMASSRWMHAFQWSCRKTATNGSLGIMKLNDIKADHSKIYLRFHVASILQSSIHDNFQHKTL